MKVKLGCYFISSFLGRWAAGSPPYGRAFLWEDGSMINLGTLGGTSQGYYAESEAYDINERGQVVGGSASPISHHPSILGNYHPFVWENGKMADLGFWGVAYGINNHTQVVGWFRTSAEGAASAFVWQSSEMIDLNEVIPTESGWVLRVAKGINNAGQIVGEGTNPAGFYNSTFLLTPRKKVIVVVIPGINDHGEEMIEGAKILLSCGDECLVLQIRELDHLSDEAIRRRVIEKSSQAKEQGKDLIVNIDMDLEDFSWEYPIPPPLNRWNRSVEWGGSIANIVSEAFAGENPEGFRRLYAHSAGVDATHNGIRGSNRERMYDDLNLLNGRTNAHSFRGVLQSRGYQWWQVKVFTSEGDLPALPWMSLSNYDAARQLADQGAWVHLHSLDIRGHSGLRDSLVTGETGHFLVNLGGQATDEYLGTVAEMMLNDWQ